MANINKILSQLAIPLDAIKQDLQSKAEAIANKSVLNSPAKKLKTPKNGELTFFGAYAWSPPITDEEEIQALLDGNWSPATLDFMAVTGLNSDFSIGNIEALLLEIAQYSDYSIKRLNFFTHANSISLGIAGEIDTSNVYFTSFEDESSVNYAADNWVNIESSEGVKYKMDDIRKKFKKDGFIVLYACHLGANTGLLKALANLFRAKVYGFKEAIFFCPPTQLKPPFKRKGMKIGLNKVSGACNTNPTVSDWKDLINDPDIIKVDSPAVSVTTEETP